MQVASGAWRYALAPLLAAPIVAVLSIPAAVGLAILALAVLAFFRDPERFAPDTGVLAPADGRISVLRREDDRVRLGVFMNVWNVHVARAPTTGTVGSVEHTPGAHRPAFSKDSDRNERVHVRFENTGDAHTDSASDSDNALQVAADCRIEEVTMIAGSFARRITPYPEPGETVTRGERIGHIAFGSRIDVVFSGAVSPEDLAVERGQRVRAGETVILEDDQA